MTVALADVNATLAALAARYLRPWRESGVSLAAVDEAHRRWADYRDAQWGGYVPVGEANNRLLRVNIIGNKLYYYGCVASTSTRRLARQEAALRLLQAVLDTRPLPDIDIVLSISDRPTVPKSLVRPGAAPPPVFAYALTPSHYAIPFPPVSFDPRRWRPLHAQLLAAGRPPLSSRRPVALWRGSCNSLCDMMRGRKCSWPRDASLLPRTALVRAAARCPRLCDVGITASHRNCPGFAPRPAVPMAAHTKHALLLHVDGNGFSGRLDELLTLGAAILKQASPFAAYYYPLLRPGTHYQPLHRNLSNLCRATRALANELRAVAAANGTAWGASPPAQPAGAGNSRRVATLAAGATSFATRYLSPAAVGEYVAAVLSGYAALQRFTPRVHPKAIPWTPHAPARPWKRGGAGMGARRHEQHDGAADGAVPPAALPRGRVQRCGGAACCRRHPKAHGCPRA